MFVEGVRGAPIDPALIEAYRQVGTSTLGHMTDFGFLRGLTPLRRSVRVAGPALTVRIPHLDSTAVHCALDAARPGDLVVVDQSGDSDRACWGGSVSYAAMKRGVVGAVLAGAVTDVSEIVELAFPIWYRTVSPVTTRLLGLEGAINVPIAVGGVVIHPGDLVFADEDGVAMLPVAEAERLATILTEKEAPERMARFRARIDAGESLADISGARRLFEAKRAPAGAKS